MKKFLCVCVAWLAFSSAAQAKDWQIDYAHSKLGFTGSQSGESFDGGFKNFTAQVSFDPDHPDTAKIAVTVDTASAYAGAADRDAMLPEKDWFDAKKFPQAQFTVTSVRKTASGFEATATLSIKGITRTVILPFTLSPEGDHWRVQGKTDLVRKDFGVGQGMFSDEAYVKYGVSVTVDLTAKPVP